MTSLGASLPPPGSSVWRSDRAVPGEDDQVVSESRVRHVVIREATIRQAPTKHVVYHIEVNTQSDRWHIERRYSEFVTLQQNLPAHAKKGMLPSKRMTGNLTAPVIEDRRQRLERYLQRLVNGDKEVVFAPALLKFLEVNEHNVIWVAQHLARHLELYGEKILSASISFHITATQANCVCRRLKLPINSKTIHQTLGGGDESEPSVDLSHLYDFVAQLEHLCVHPRRYANINEENAPVHAVTADLSPWRSLKKLEIDHFAVGYFDGFTQIHENLTDLRVAFGDVKEIRQVVLDAVARKRSMPQAAGNKVESWRQAAMKNFSENRTYYKPWVRLTMLDLTSNCISEFDSSCFDQLPALEKLILKWNKISNLNLWFKNGPIMPRLNEIDLSCNQISTLETMYTEEDRTTRAPSISLRKTAPIVNSPQKPSSPVVSVPAIKVDPRWVAPDGIGKSLPFGHTIKATPANTLPPSYSANHLISTDAPKASLDELQRRRAQRQSVASISGSQDDESPRASLDSQNQDVPKQESVVSGRASLMSVGTLERVTAAATAQAIGGELDVRKRAENPGVSRGQLPLATSQNTFRSFYRLAPALARLYLSNNSLQSLRGLEHLNALEYLDVSFNVIATVQAVSAVVHMTKLKVMVLEGNPVTSERSYRSEIASRFVGPRETTIDGKVVCGS